MATPKILLIYTGGTIGMAEDQETGSLIPLDFDHLAENIPELNRLNCEIEILSPFQPIDSSNATPHFWIKISTLIYENYNQYEGFVVLHGTDTMAYTATAVSFMLRGIQKPVIFTGSQLPVGVIRTDGKENLITAIEIAAAQKEGKSIVQEVAIYFEYQLLRANRTRKNNAQHFDAFSSPNYPPLAEAGVDIFYQTAWLSNNTNSAISLNTAIDSAVFILKIFPGIQANTLLPLLENPTLKGIVLESYGAGNAPSDSSFKDILSQCIQSGKPIVNVTQCYGGSIMPGKYQSGKWLSDIGVIPGYDMTTESALIKLMMGLKSQKPLPEFMFSNLAGEITI